MRIGVSGLAWEIAEDAAVAQMLHEHAVDAIDVVPSKYFQDPRAADTAQITRVRAWWAERGIEIIGMQALLFGTTGLNLFGGRGVQAAMLDHLQEMCRIGALLGATRLVLGSPKSRDRSGLSESEARDIAIVFFRRLGAIAVDHGVMFCLEPCPSHYGGNFLLNSADTATIVTEIDHPAIGMQFDTGATNINSEDPGQVVRDYGHLIGHIHASEPSLLPLGEGSTDHVEMAVALREGIRERVISIEMLPAKSEPHLKAIERALQVAIRHYR